MAILSEALLAAQLVPAAWYRSGWLRGARFGLRRLRWIADRR
eukprot:CAMPEP_0204615772 /NCGR_PEP_ID=MMETSP0717-20131115/3176_1 /ASSEMBLY_ACC=CAM_ASM_000666 /TAXON_ID=230516 /ORGANISM="Chaetoceros curvisetus" /LENGTH=41 /DNA_ID= /DNA_START= /DNA_END= /DNA_ORIENTATION=